MASTDPVLVLGGTGHYGRRIVASLVARGEPVRVMSRSPDAAAAVLGDAPEVVAGDLGAADTVAAALDGVRAVVIAVSAFSWKLCRQRLAIERDGVLALLEQMERTGVNRLVYLSGYDVREDYVAALKVDVFARPMLDVQAALDISPLNWTILGCPPSMETFFAMIRGDRMNVPGGGPPAVPTISPDDVGAIAAQAAGRRDLPREHFRMAGPEALSFPEAARRISAVWGRTIRVRPIPLLPMKLAALVTRPFNPFLSLLVAAVTLLNNFPQDLVERAPEDHQRLKDTFDFTPTSLEAEARRRTPAQP